MKLLYWRLRLRSRLCALIRVAVLVMMTIIAIKSTTNNRSPLLLLLLLLLLPLLLLLLSLSLTQVSKGRKSLCSSWDDEKSNEIVQLVVLKPPPPTRRFQRIRDKRSLRRLTYGREWPNVAPSALSDQIHLLISSSCSRMMRNLNNERLPGKTHYADRPPIFLLPTST